MAEVKGTSGKDFYTVKNGENYDALEGDDEITYEKGGTAQGGAGNDKMTVPDGFSIYDATVWYWSSPKAIYVDLEAGYALDGHGTRDTFINVHNVHGANSLSSASKSCSTNLASISKLSSARRTAA